MMRSLTVSAALIALCAGLAAPSFAQNSATITQPGVGNSGTIEQIGSGPGLVHDNTASILQDGNYNYAKTTQGAADDGEHSQNKATVKQSTNFNRSEITQLGAFDVDKGQTATVTQGGAGGPGGGNISDVYQKGADQSKATVKQDGYHNVSRVNQTANKLTATVEQKGSDFGLGNYAQIDQVPRSGGSDAKIIQDGNRNYGKIAQGDSGKYERKNNADIRHEGSFNSTTIVQKNSEGVEVDESNPDPNNNAIVTARNDAIGNFTSLLQDGLGNYARVNQDGGWGNSVIGVQDGLNHELNVNQSDGLFNRLISRQEGEDQDATVNQSGGSWNTAFVLQTNSGNVATVNQSGGVGNFASVTQN